MVFKGNDVHWNIVWPIKLRLGSLVLRKSIMGDFVNVLPGERTGYSEKAEKSRGDGFRAGTAGGSSTQTICSGASSLQSREGFS